MTVATLVLPMKNSFVELSVRHQRSLTDAANEYDFVPFC